MAKLPAAAKRVLFVVGHIRASNSAQGPCGFEALEPACTGIVTYLKLHIESEDSCSIDLAPCPGRFWLPVCGFGQSHHELALL